jgi:hypothetical protein
VNVERCYREKRKIGGERGINIRLQDTVSQWFFQSLEYSYHQNWVHRPAPGRWPDLAALADSRGAMIAEMRRQVKYEAVWMKAGQVHKTSQASAAK